MISLSNSITNNIVALLLQYYSDMTILRSDCNILLLPVMQLTQPAITCLKLTVETIEQCVKYVQS